MGVEESEQRTVELVERIRSVGVTAMTGGGFIEMSNVGSGYVDARAKWLFPGIFGYDSVGDLRRRLARS